MTKRVLHEAGKVRRQGTAVTILGPGREDLEAIGVNLMDPRRRVRVLDTSLRTSARALSAGDATLPAARRCGSTCRRPCPCSAAGWTAGRPRPAQRPRSRSGCARCTARLAVDEAEAAELGWYAVQELPDLLR